MSTTTYNGNGHKGSVYAHSLHGELVVVVGVPPEEASRRQIVIKPRELIKNPDQFLQDLVRELGTVAIIPAHPSNPNLLYAGSPKHGYVLSVLPQYEDQLEKIIDNINVI